MSVQIEFRDDNDYYNIDCANCGRMRVEIDGICEKCGFDNNDYIRSRKHSEGTNAPEKN